MLYETARRLAAFGVSLILCACGGARSTLATPNAEPVRHLQGTIPIYDRAAWQNWKIDVFSRNDGWVELSLATVRREDAGFPPWLRFAEPLPWIIGRGYYGNKPREPVWTRALFTPAEIRAATRTADSVIEAAANAKLRGVLAPQTATHLLTRMSGRPEWGETTRLFNWYAFPPGVGTTSGQLEMVYFGISSCLGMESDPLLTGRGVERTIADYREMLRLLDSAADRSATRRLSARPVSPELVSAQEAGCTAHPRRGSPTPPYPAGGQSRVADVQLDAIVDTLGNVERESVRVVATAGAVYDEAAIVAVWQLRFSPALLTTAIPLRQRFRLQVHFSPDDLTAMQIDDLAVRAAAQGAEILLLSERGNVGGRASEL